MLVVKIIHTIASIHSVNQTTSYISIKLQPIAWMSTKIECLQFIHTTASIYSVVTSAVYQPLHKCLPTIEMLVAKTFTIQLQVYTL